MSARPTKQSTRTSTNDDDARRSETNDGVDEPVDLDRGQEGRHKKEKVLLVFPVELLAEVGD